MGSQALTSHAGEDKHRKNFGKRPMYLKYVSKVAEKPSRSGEQQQQPSSSISNEEHYSNKSVNSSKKQLIELMLKDTQKQKVEIIWTLQTVMNKYSNNSCKNLNKLFSCMSPDSKIAQLIELCPAKLEFIVTFEMTSHFRKILYEETKKVDCYMILFNESLNYMTQNCQMDILAIFFDPV